MRLVPAPDEPEDRHPRLDLRPKPAPIQELALERREEALAHGVVVRVPGAEASTTNPEPTSQPSQSGDYHTLLDICMNVKSRRVYRYVLAPAGLLPWCRRSSEHYLAPIHGFGCWWSWRRR